jgi:hypothetical protein
MDPSKLIHDPAKVQSYIRETPDGKLIAAKPIKLYIPTRFAERNLASVGIETHTVGIAGLVVEDTYYALFLVNATMRIEPTSLMKIMVGDDEYYEFFFEAGSTLVSTTKLVKIDTLVFRIYDEIIAKGRVPWYLGYDELGKLFDTAKPFAGANIGQNQEVTELIVSMIARDADDRTKYYRQTVKSRDDLKKRPPAFIPLRSVQYSATNTVNKLAGSYWSDALTSALVSPADRSERIEKLLRK